VKSRNLIDNLVVDVDRMRANLTATRGLVFSQAVLLALVDKGLSRDVAYRIVQGHAMEAWNNEGDLRDLLAGDPEVLLSDEELETCFSIERVSGTSAIVFERLSSLHLGRTL
jgi:adenylosuccinate lyase